jgi:hypothetical protein
MRVANVAESLIDFTKGSYKMTKCKYCFVPNKENETSCHKCGAPLPIKSEPITKWFLRQPNSHHANDYGVHIIDRLECNDGFAMSVQASAYHHCTPEETGKYNYSAFEVGYPSEFEPLFMEWAEELNEPTNTVYNWVPAEVIDEVIEKHGGIKN